ncbi:YsnF/AvaK domain-containing protein [Spirosoma sp. BT702]|uniref:YsnF/AvaK domain-containing protein n=1 Tax=Spirosoma profusum TaxID=2771354 RepID=A0A927ATY2_9BACT|nr:YsnF/AvaK domain-containing protein [Spirosoma profusum]MBD2701442.1 YsnF/AvaK domain-containing protein [Spirosoma profusum]
MNNSVPPNTTPLLHVPPATDSANEETLLIPRLEEQLHIDKQLVETSRVLITKTVREEPQTVQIPLISETIEIERVELNQYVEEPPLTRQEGDTTIYPVMKEVLVIQKRLMLVEEIRVTRRQIQTQQTQSVPLRREDVHIERIDASSGRPAPHGPSL